MLDINKNKLETITRLFEGYEIRSVWNSKEEYDFDSVDDILLAYRSIVGRI